MSNPIHEYGLTAVPASATALLTSTPEYPRLHANPPPIPVSETPIPTTALAQRINAYAKAQLPEPTYNHSLRVYHFGLAIKKHRLSFDDWAFSDETYFLACVLHDIGTTETNIKATHLSFEFYGGFLALQLLQDSEGSQGSSASSGSAAPREQAESVAEAIIRHQDLCQVGKITAVGQLLQLATIFDNTGSYADLVHPDTIKDVSAHFPRHHWSGCFAATIRRENGLKPWAHTTALGEEDFPAKVLANTLMEPYE
ncbi:HD domain containing protein [Penicillium verhagenii]|uniref:HD domain containing protein n=1 Tax=Penicillium verhagenii TaxID=1562060 RepID=UPI0025451838|nr:HD domain containing protein [Penicillium verhagenii]KAJ5917432.1 HD domain containing protein [Penicillium verhagenii]